MRGTRTKEIKALFYLGEKDKANIIESSISAERWMKYSRLGVSNMVSVPQFLNL